MNTIDFDSLSPQEYSTLMVQACQQVDPLDKDLVNKYHQMCLSFDFLLSQRDIYQFIANKLIILNKKITDIYIANIYFILTNEKISLKQLTYIKWLVKKYLELMI